MFAGIALLFVLVNPSDFATNHRLGEFYIRQKDFTRALPYLERAYSAQPADYANAFDLATLCLQLKKVSQARAIVTALLRQGDKAELHNLLADVEEADGHVDEAARQYEIAARLDPTEKNLFDLGSDLLNHRGFEPALKVFVYATGRYPKSVRARVGLGVAYYSLGHYDDAVAALCEAVDLDPKDTKAYDFLGKMYDVSPQYAGDVTTRLAHFVERYPASAAANYYYALSLRKRTLGGSAANATAAEPFLRKAVRNDPAFTAAHYELGLLCEDLGASAEAIQQYQIAVRQQPDLEKAHYRLARLYTKAGQEQLARQEFAIVEKLKVKQSQR
jgi:tetratricopeptide (TPR) repeat protein